MTRTPTLFDAAALPDGFQYRGSFLDQREERALLDEVARLDFHHVHMRGVVARRRVIQYGWKYSFESFRTTEGPPLPEFLRPVRDRAAAFAGVAAESLSEALVTEYSPGAAIGWHRDAPGFGLVVGISLLAPCRFRFRRGRAGAWETQEIRLDPRSAYLLSGPARSEWQHSIPPLPALRFSITFRTLRQGTR